MQGKIINYLLTGLFVIFLASCNNPSDNSKTQSRNSSAEEDFSGFETVIARVNGYPIALEDLEEEVANYNSLVPENRSDLKITTSEQKINYLKNEIIKRIFLYQEAKSRGLDRDPEIRKTLKKIELQILVSKIMEEEMSNITVSPSEIEEYYQGLPEVYRKEPESRKVSEILVSGKEQANQLLIRLLGGENFSNIARKHSLAPSAKDGGDLGFIVSGSKFKEFDRIVFSDILDVGQLSSIFNGPGGYYIVRLEDKRPGKEKSVMEMWDDIKLLIERSKQQEKMNSLIERLSTGADIDVREELIQY